MTRSAKSRGPHPDYSFDRVTDIDPAWIKELGITGVMLDIDNTITRWEDHHVPAAELEWLQRLKGAGLACRLISNGIGSKRAKIVEQTGIPQSRGLAVKPMPAAFQKCLRDLNLPADKVLMIGDIVMTDILPANRIGVWTCLVKPLSHIDFIGTKAWRIMERAMKWRRPFTKEGDFSAGADEA